MVKHTTKSSVPWNPEPFEAIALDSAIIITRDDDSKFAEVLLCNSVVTASQLHVESAFFKRRVC